MHAYATVCTEICNIQYIPGVKHKDCNISKVEFVRSQESQTVCASMQWELLQKATHSLKL